jgi:undecaprenol kinase
LVQAAGTGVDRPYSAVVGRVRERALSFRHALRGLRVAGTGANFRIHLAAAVAASVAATGYGLRRAHLALVVLAIVGVLGAELMNTAVERP